MSIKDRKSVGGRSGFSSLGVASLIAVVLTSTLVWQAAPSLSVAEEPGGFSHIPISAPFLLLSSNLHP